MKCLMRQRLVLSISMTLLLTFSVQTIVDALIPESVVPQALKLRSSETIREDNTVSIAAKDDIAISEIMYATDIHRSPQWIELHNRNTQRVNLDGWKVKIENHPEDKSVLATKLIFTLGEKILDANQTLLLVTEQGDNSGVGEARGALRAESVVILKDLIGGKQGYRLLSQTAFKVTLTTPTVTKTEHKIRSDIAGNLGATPEWKLPVIAENQRSSIIRVYEDNDTSDGTTADGWELAREKDFRYRQPTYYGSHSDHATPGYRETDPLPVELSHFRAARDKATGAVKVTWSTQAELNNAGFFIKRSPQRIGEPKVIHTPMIPGAGTTKTEQSYTYIDTTAQPHVVYYYQLECVSIDGTRQTLTRLVRLKGHIGGSGYLFEEAPFWWKDLNR